MRNISQILRSIKDYKGFKTNAELAEFLGVGRSAISNWIARGKIDESLIMEKIPEIRPEFLRSGQFPMTEQNDLISILLKRIDRLERTIADLEEQIKKKGAD
jgi:transcriptional regulator with XRE-family HTH domain